MIIKFDQTIELPLNILNEYHYPKGCTLIIDLPYSQENFNILSQYLLENNNNFNKIEVFNDFNNKVYDTTIFCQVNSLNKFINNNDMYIQIRLIKKEE